MFELICCWIGFHDWDDVTPIPVVNRCQPTRQCTQCLRIEGLFRGAGGDDWMEIE